MRQSPVKCILWSAARSLKNVPSLGYVSTLEIAATVQNVYAVYKIHVISQNSRRKRWRLKDTPTAAIFCCKGTDQHVRVRSKIYLRATVQDGVSGLNKQLQDFFCFLCTIWPLFSPFSRWRFKYILTAANFLLRKNKYGCSLSYLYRKNDCV
jgi:hypothetical protein